ncbi:MAG: putative 26S proteasome regulatory subunit T2 [Streblomastix strix]|uniref:Putative 26S proteasome regulatory subunit T2 n=1 Tax=Streblomastix strix TaxID=222440 RepID=A0A5J4WZK7_9EUKA|nr:MAG: putative 26S proteasome regulatory subunit T2 [Streblomastix strix]
MGNNLPQGFQQQQPGDKKPNKEDKDKKKEKQGERKVWKYEKSAQRKTNKIPDVIPLSKCRLRQLRLERIKDHLLLEEEFIKTQENIKPKTDEAQKDRKAVDEIRGTPMQVGTLEEMIDDNHAVISQDAGPEYYVSIMSFVDREQLDIGSTVLTHNTKHAVVGLLSDETDPLVSVMKVEKAPPETYADVGGLEKQIQEIKEAVELPLTHPELYEDIGIKPPKGVILYGEPGTGKTLLAKAVAHETQAQFLRVVGSELVQKYLGEGPKLVRELFRTANELAPSIVFIDEIDAIGTKRYDSHSGGEKEIQRTMLELLNQLDGFDPRGEVKVLMATNRIETLDPALIRPGRIDRKIEFPLPDAATKKRIFEIHTKRMTLAPDVKLEELYMSKEQLSGADIKAICTESGLLALRKNRRQVCHADLIKAKEKVLYKKKEGQVDGLYL